MKLHSKHPRRIGFLIFWEQKLYVIEACVINQAVVHVEKKSAIHCYIDNVLPNQLKFQNHIQQLSHKFLMLKK